MTAVQAHALQLLIDVSDMDWADYALCAEVGGDLHFPEKSEPSAPANRICMACEVRAECAEYALTHQIQHGVWGGLSPRDRRAVLRARLQDRRAA